MSYLVVIVTLFIVVAAGVIGMLVYTGELNKLFNSVFKKSAALKFIENVTKLEGFSTYPTDNNRGLLASLIAYLNNRPESFVYKTIQTVCDFTNFFKLLEQYLPDNALTKLFSMEEENGAQKLCASIIIGGEVVYVCMVIRPRDVIEYKGKIMPIQGIFAPSNKIVKYHNKSSHYFLSIIEITLAYPTSFKGNEEKLEALRKSIEESEVVLVKEETNKKVYTLNTLIPAIGDFNTAFMQVSKSLLQVVNYAAVKPAAYNILARIAALGLNNVIPDRLKGDRFIENLPALLRQKGSIILTGAPRSGKTSFMMLIYIYLFERGYNVFFLPQLNADNFQSISNFVAGIGKEIMEVDEDEEDSSSTKKEAIILIDDINLSHLSIAEIDYLKSLMDGPTSNTEHSVRIILSTNTPFEEIDPAIVAPGRTQVVLEFKPDTFENWEQLKEKGSINMKGGIDQNSVNRLSQEATISLGQYLAAHIEPQDVAVLYDLYED